VPLPKSKKSLATPGASIHETLLTLACRAVIEIIFGRLKDWRRVATRYDRCPKVFLSAIALAATVIYWL
jgi:transposase